MISREVSSRPRSTSASETRPGIGSPPRIVLLSMGMALVALGIGALLLDWEPAPVSVMSRDTTSAEHSSIDAGSSATSSSVENTDTSTSGRDAVTHADNRTISAESVGGVSDERLADSIQNGDELITRTNARLVTNPLPIEKADGNDAAFHARVDALRAEIETLRKELKSSSP